MSYAYYITVVRRTEIYEYVDGIIVINALYWFMFARIASVGTCLCEFVRLFVCMCARVCARVWAWMCVRVCVGRCAILQWWTARPLFSRENTKKLIIINPMTLSVSVWNNWFSDDVRALNYYTICIITSYNVLWCVCGLCVIYSFIYSNVHV